MCIVFFFKQKTAYEMRISDWSSDVCSSDLCRERIREREVHADTDADERHGVEQTGDEEHAAGEHASHFRLTGNAFEQLAAEQAEADGRAGAAEAEDQADREDRSEEHTSELQSLMRISYAVFCLKKKNTNNETITIH